MSADSVQTESARARIKVAMRGQFTEAVAARSAAWKAEKDLTEARSAVEHAEKRVAATAATLAAAMAALRELAGLSGDRLAGTQGNYVVNTVMRYQTDDTNMRSWAFRVAEDLAAGSVS